MVAAPATTSLFPHGDTTAMKRILHIACSLLAVLAFVHIAMADKPLDIGNRRELFVDDYMVGSMKNVELKMHEPVRRDISIKWDKPWEGCGGGYTTVFQDGDKYRMYYHAWQIPGNGSKHPQHPLFICEAESKDGIHWTRPDLGLFEFNGSKHNNIVLKDIKGNDCHDLSPFIDKNPKATPDGKYKAVGLALGPKSKVTGLWALKSPDGINWTLIKDGPVYTKGVFDTQNIAYWSQREKQYVLYYRVFVKGVRHIERAVSDDFINWKTGRPARFRRRRADNGRTVLCQPDQALLSCPAYPHRFSGPICRQWNNGVNLSAPRAGSPQATCLTCQALRNRGYR